MTDAKQTRSSRRGLSHSFDEELGAKVKALRLGAGMSQAELGARLGVSHQQVQKYESGKDRLTVYALTEMAAALGSPLAVFFDDIPLSSGRMPVVREAMKAVSAIQRIEDPTLRRRLLDLIAELTKANTDRAKKA